MQVPPHVCKQIRKGERSQLLNSQFQVHFIGAVKDNCDKTVQDNPFIPSPHKRVDYFNKY